MINDRKIYESKVQEIYDSLRIEYNEKLLNLKKELETKNRDKILPVSLHNQSSQTQPIMLVDKSEQLCLQMFQSSSVN